MNCEQTREHLESCEECRLHVAVEARLRSEPVLDPPRGLAARVMRALPRTGPVGYEIARIAAAAVLLIGLAAGAVGFGLHHHEAVESGRARVTATIQSFATTFDWLKNDGAAQ